MFMLLQHQASVLLLIFQEVYGKFFSGDGRFIFSQVLLEMIREVCVDFLDVMFTFMSPSILCIPVVRDETEHFGML